MKTMSLMATVAGFAIIAIPANAAAFSGSGSGTSEDPYQITTCSQLQEIGDDLAAHYALANDVDCSETSGWSGGAGFEPVMGFFGTLDGAGHKIMEFNIDRPGDDSIGLFGQTSGAALKNLSLENAHVTGYRFTGAFVGKGHSGDEITDCYSTGHVTASYMFTGGLAGINYGRISGSHSSSAVYGTYGTGGVAGQNEGTIELSYATGDITGDGDTYDYAGGLVGINYGTITDCYSTGTLDSPGAYAGGLVSGNYGTIANSYSISPVSGNDFGGGLIGDNLGTVSNCFSAGSVSGPATDRLGGLVGWQESGSITNCYWDIERSGRDTCAGWGSSSDCHGVNPGGSEPDYFFFSTNPPMDQWDFLITWGVDEGLDYPYLVDPAGPAEFVLDVEASYEGGVLSLAYSVGTPEPATWANYAILTYSGIVAVPLWIVPLPVTDPPMEFPVTFPMPSVGWLGIWTGLFTEAGTQAVDIAWVNTGLPSH